MERKEFREWSVYDKQKDGFYNLDYSSSLEEQYTKELPIRGFTYEECRAFLVHVDNKESCTIINIEQPKFLLHYELDVYRKTQHQLKVKAQNEDSQSLQQFSIDANKKSTGKNNFDQAFNKWVQNKSNFTTEKEMQSAQPKIEEYSLKADDFNERDKKHLKQYGFKASWLD